MRRCLLKRCQSQRNRSFHSHVHTSCDGLHERAGRAEARHRQIRETRTPGRSGPQPRITSPSKEIKRRRTEHVMGVSVGRCAHDASSRQRASSRRLHDRTALRATDPDGDDGVRNDIRDLDDS